MSGEVNGGGCAGEVLVRMSRHRQGIHEVRHGAVQVDQDVRKQERRYETVVHCRRRLRKISWPGNILPPRSESLYCEIECVRFCGPSVIKFHFLQDILNIQIFCI